MIPYYILITMFSLLAIDSYKNKEKSFFKNGKKDPWWYIIPYLMLFMVFAFRGSSVGTDTSHYEAIFNKQDFVGLELLYRAVNLLAYQISSNFIVVNIIIGAILVYTFYLVFDTLSENKHLLFLIFIGLTFFVQTMNGTRQYLALGFIMLAFACLTRKEYIFSIIFYIVAFFFHKSSIVCIALFIIYLIPFNKKTFALYLTGAIALVPIFPYLVKAFDKVLGTYYFSAYMYKVGSLSIMKILEIIAGVATITFLLLFRKYAFKKISKKEQKIYDFCIVDCLIFIVTVITTVLYSSFISRISIYFLFPLILIVPIILKCIKLPYRDFILASVIVGCFVCNFYFIQLVGSFGVYPYVTRF